MIYPGLWNHRKFYGISSEAFRVWVWMVSQADDEGRAEYYPGLVAQVPFLGCPLSDEDAVAAIAEVAERELADLYDANGRSYYQLHDWSDFQTIRKDRLVPSTCPTSPRFAAECGETRRNAALGGLKVKDNDKGNGNDSESPAAPGASADAVRLTDLLAKRVRAWNAITPIPEPGTPGRAKWEKAVDQLLRLGPPGSGVAVKPAQVEAVIHWIDTSAQGEFWRANILSAGALREKFPKLWGQRRRDLDKDNHADRAALDAAQTKRARKAAAEPERVGGGDLAAAGPAIAAVLGKLGGKE